MDGKISSVPFTHQDRQWDGRFNVPTDDDLSRLLTGVRTDVDGGRIKYILVSGLEVGTRPQQDDYGIRHVHVAAIFCNRVSKSSILKNWNIKTGNGYYLVPRQRDLPYSGWRNHHIKAFSKLDPTSTILYEVGDLPADEPQKRIQLGEEEKKRKIDDILIDMRGLIESNKESEAWMKYPRNYLIYGERIKSMITQKRDFFKNNGDPHIWLWGYAGTGKTALLSFLYPNYYKKNLHNKFWELYNPEVHTHVILEDVSHEAVERLSIDFLKNICDESGFAIDQKYKSCKLARTTVLVTSNFQINDLLEGPGTEQNAAALYRRFWHVNIYALLRVLGLKLVPKWQRTELKKSGNSDSSKLFMTWDYATDMPLCVPLKDVTDYQEIVRQAYYAQ